MARKIVGGFLCVALSLIMSWGLLGCAPAAVSPLSPPLWIQGTWSDVGPTFTWVFTSDDAAYTVGPTTIHWGQMNGIGGTSVSESETVDTYTVTVDSGPATTNYTFQLTDPSTVLYLGLINLTKR